MRNIEFRALSKFEKKWVYGYLIVVNNEYRISTHQFGLQIEVDKDTLGQFTGALIDGKELFEGDLVRDRRYDYDDLFEVRYDESKACFYRTIIEDGKEFEVLYSFDSDITEIVGNIHKK